jgi:hypothetical protein
MKPPTKDKNEEEAEVIEIVDDDDDVSVLPTKTQDELPALLLQERRKSKSAIGRQRELACTAIAAHNVHESRNAGKVQEGGTGGICFGDATGYIRKV